MKLLACLVPWMAMTAAWAQSTQLAKVNYSYFEETKSVAIHDGSDCWVPVDAVKPWGWRLSASRRSVTIEAEGRTLVVPTRENSGTTYLQLNEATRQLGANSWWDADNIFHITGTIRSISLEGSHILVDGTLAFKTNSFLLDGPRRLVVDFYGLALDGDSSFELPANARIGQNSDQVVRLVITDPKIIKPGDRVISSRFLDLSVAPYKFGSSSVTEPPFTILDPTNGGTNNGGTTPPPAPITGTQRHLEDVIIERNGSNAETVRFNFDLPGLLVPQVAYDDASTVVVTLPSTVVVGDTSSLPHGNLVRSISFQPMPDGSLRAIIRTAQPLVFNASAVGSSATILLSKPRNADGHLAGKRIVIDAGHGGKDSGATCGGATEKILTLSIARLAAQELTDLGASVIMTRNSDVFVELRDRAKIANDNHADLFVSIHINSNKVENTVSGTITFHHAQAPEGKLLAKCIFDEIAKVNNLPDIGVWSDTKIYTSGFAVLRWTSMPATLLELGFITHQKDRAQMGDAKWQQRVAEAIAQGIKVYLGDAEKTNPLP